MSVSALRGEREVSRVETGDARRWNDVPASRSRTALVRHPVRSRRRRGHAKVSGELHVRERKRSGPYPFGPDIAERVARTATRSSSIAAHCTLHELFTARWNGGDRRPAAARSSIDGSEGEPRFDRRDGRAPMRGLPIFAGLLRYDEVKAS